LGRVISATGPETSHGTPASTSARTAPGTSSWDRLLFPRNQTSSVSRSHPGLRRQAFSEPLTTSNTRWMNSGTDAATWCTRNSSWALDENAFEEAPKPSALLHFVSERRPTTDDVGETTDDLDETTGDVGETTADVGETGDDLNETGDDRNHPSFERPNPSRQHAQSRGSRASNDV
jgi:hypothetical protein